MNIEEAKEKIKGKMIFSSKTTENGYAYMENIDEAIETVLSELEKKEKRISDLEFALMDMVLQFADENKYSINTMGLSALEIAFGELDFDNPMLIKEVHKRYKKLAQEYYKVEREGK